MIQDRKIIAENGETVLKGLDEALKFVRLESDRTFSKLGDGQTFADKEMGYDENNICRIKTTPGSDCALTSLAVDEPLEYARLYLEGNLQMWVDAEDSLEL